MRSAAALALAAVAALATAAPRRLALPCSSPQPRSFDARRLTEAAPDVILTPPYAVLHRCDNGAGCCLGGLSCEPVDQQEVQLVFMATKVVRGDPDAEDYRLVTASNHTSCGCVDLSERRER